MASVIPLQRSADTRQPVLVGPCPIPRCALEVYLSICLIVMGLLTLLSDIVGGGALTAIVLSTGLFGIGTFQLCALWLSPRFVHRLAAGIAWMLLILFVYARAKLPYPDVPFIGIAVIALAGEFYIFAMLRGATWRTG